MEEVKESFLTGEEAELSALPKEEAKVLSLTEGGVMSLMEEIRSAFLIEEGFRTVEVVERTFPLSEAEEMFPLVEVEEMFRLVGTRGLMAKVFPFIVVEGSLPIVEVEVRFFKEGEVGGFLIHGLDR
jgi:hypothetical protein